MLVFWSKALRLFFAAEVGYVRVNMLLNCLLSKSVVLIADDGINCTVIKRLICQLNLDFTSLSQEVGIDFTDYFAAYLCDIAR